MTESLQPDARSVAERPSFSRRGRAERTAVERVPI